MKKFIYQIFGFEKYLFILSSLYFISYRLGVLKTKREYAYHYYLKNIIHAGDTVIDIGANLGYYSVLFAQWTGVAGRVYCVEPVPQIAKVLVRNTARYPNVKIYFCALGEENKNITMINNSLEKFGYITSGRNSVYTSGSDAGDKAMTFKATMKRGSELFGKLEKIDFIKCDVEGYELFILEDMKELIRKHKPAILLETDGANRAKAIRLLESLNYQGWILINNQLELIDNSRSESADILFLKKE